MKKRETCRISGKPLKELFSLGELYVSDFPKAGEKTKSEKVELALCRGEESGLIQLNYTADQDSMYAGNYWYRSGTNNTMKRELGLIASEATKMIPWDKGDIWIDIGCNDGTLLQRLPPEIQCIGYDPSKENCKIAAENPDLLIYNDYFNFKHYATHVKDKAKFVSSIAMFYDLDDPRSFIDDVYGVLKDDGLWVLQLSYTPLMLKQLAFDNICHEHLCYYDLTTLVSLMDEQGFDVVDFHINDTNGGSCRVYLQKKCCRTIKNFMSQPYRDVAEYRIESTLYYEDKYNSKSLQNQQYEIFFKQIEQLKHNMLAFIEKAKAEKKTVWGYGASTKANTLLQYFGLGPKDIEAIADRQVSKWGRTTVGTNIPITSEEDMRVRHPDYLLVLPWHFIEEFKRREYTYLENGGKMVVPCPKFEIIGLEGSLTDF